MKKKKRKVLSWRKSPTLLLPKIPIMTMHFYPFFYVSLRKVNVLDSQYIHIVSGFQRRMGLFFLVCCWPFWSFIVLMWKCLQILYRVCLITVWLLKFVWRSDWNGFFSSFQFWFCILKFSRFEAINWLLSTSFFKKKGKKLINFEFV